MVALVKRPTSWSSESRIVTTHYCDTVRSWRLRDYVDGPDLTEEWDSALGLGFDTSLNTAGESIHMIGLVSLSRPPPYLRRRFNELVQQWIDDTIVSSSSSELYMHSAYQQVIGLGRRVLPLILDEIIMGELHWSWALSAITGENPAANSRSPRAATEAWLRWAKEQGLVAEQCELP